MKRPAAPPSSRNNGAPKSEKPPVAVGSKSPAELKPPTISASSAASAALVARPVKRPMPTSIYPMLAESSSEPFDSPDWLFEIKWDGYRAVAFIEKGKAPPGFAQPE